MVGADLREGGEGGGGGGGSRGSGIIPLTKTYPFSN